MVCTSRPYIKRVYRVDACLVSINPKYKDIFISYEEDPRLWDYRWEFAPMVSPWATLIIPESLKVILPLEIFYASVECVKRGLHPLKTLCVMSRKVWPYPSFLSHKLKKIFGNQCWSGL